MFFGSVVHSPFNSILWYSPSCFGPLTAIMHPWTTSRYIIRHHSCTCTRSIAIVIYITLANLQLSLRSPATNVYLGAMVVSYLCCDVCVVGVSMSDAICIYMSPGRGDLLQVQLLPCEECRSGGGRGRARGGSGQTQALASAAAAVYVDFSASDVPHRPDFPQNDGGKSIDCFHSLSMTLTYTYLDTCVPMLTIFKASSCS